MQKDPGQRRAAMTAFVAGLAFFAAEALAQAERLTPPENASGIKGKPWLTGFVLLIVVAVVGVGAFLKSKRGHQD
jgi:hypothetical protein